MQGARKLQKRSNAAAKPTEVPNEPPAVVEPWHLEVMWWIADILAGATLSYGAAMSPSLGTGLMWVVLSLGLLFITSRSRPVWQQALISFYNLAVVVTHDILLPPDPAATVYLAWMSIGILGTRISR